MSWVEKELKRRAAAAARETTSGYSKQGNTESRSDATRMSSLWERIEAANNALPPELRLRQEADKTSAFLPDPQPFRAWLIAENGAGLGWNGEGIRYLWPETNQRKSNNFWIRWHADKGYCLNRRVGASMPSVKMEVRRFDESKVDYLLQCLVMGVRVKTRSLRVRRFWFF